MVIRAVEMAVWQRQGEVPVILHSDRGSQFTSGDYHRRYRTQNEARADVFDYIERFHNPKMRRRVADQDRKLSAVLNPSVETG